MGEEGMFIPCYSMRRTTVFWNLDDYPVPNDTDLTPIRSNFKEALHLMGFHGNFEIHLLCN
ncbi:unnamed protein product [Brassica oleracea var. botrytis]